MVPCVFAFLGGLQANKKYETQAHPAHISRQLQIYLRMVHLLAGVRELHADKETNCLTRMAANAIDADPGYAGLLVSSTTTYPTSGHELKPRSTILLGLSDSQHSQGNC